MFVWDGGLWEAAVSGEGYWAEGGVLGGWGRSAPRGGSFGADQHQWGGWGRYSWVRTSTQGGSSVAVQFQKKYSLRRRKNLLSRRMYDVIKVTSRLTPEISWRRYRFSMKSALIYL